jgi:uncharacterized protein (TIGR03435 family)
MNRVRALLFLASLLAASSTLTAQTIASTWQGTLPLVATGQGSNGGSSLRIVFTIEKNPDGSFHGGVTLIDSGSYTPLTAVTFAAPDVTFVRGEALTYHGKLSADGRSIAGTLAEGNQSFALTLSLATTDTLWKPAGAVLPRMAADADPAFEVATIKPSDPMKEIFDYNLTGRTFTAHGISATELIKIAYNMRGRQVVGGPSWMGQKTYDVTGVPDTSGKPSEEQTRIMVRKLLIERFHLAARIERQDFNVLALTLDPKGPRPTPSDPIFNGGGNILTRQEGDDMLYQFSGVTIAQFLYAMMSKFRAKQIVDETGLTGIYDITLRMPASAFQGPSNHGPEDERAGAFLAAAEKAGFKFIAKKEPIPVVVIDHIDPPTPN